MSNATGETTLSKIFSYARKLIRAEIPPVLRSVFRSLVFIFDELSFPRRDRPALSPQVNILAGEKRGIFACFSRFALFRRIAGSHELAERPVYVSTSISTPFARPRSQMRYRSFRSRRLRDCFCLFAPDAGTGDIHLFGRSCRLFKKQLLSSFVQSCVGLFIFSAWRVGILDSL